MNKTGPDHYVRAFFWLSFSEVFYMISKTALFVSILFFSFASNAQEEKKDTTIEVMDESTKAAFMADSVAKAELKKYQQQHHGRLNKAQLSLVAYDRKLNIDIKGQNHIYLFDYDYNRPVGGMMYLLHFSVMVNTRSGRTVFKPVE